MFTFANRTYSLSAMEVVDIVYPIHAITDTTAPTATIILIFRTKMSHLLVSIRYRYMTKPMTDIARIKIPVILERVGLGFIR